MLCVAIRENTERPVTIEAGTNQLAGTGHEGILAAAARIGDKPAPTTRCELWDGRAALRLVDVIEGWIGLVDHPAGSTESGLCAFCLA